MTRADLAAVAAISAIVHGRYAEPVAVYADRLTFYPAGCFVWDDAGTVRGLLVSHPWRRDAPPALGALLGKIPDDVETFYLHDIALLPETRGQGAGGKAVALVENLTAQAGLDEIMLVAVNGADRFWHAHLFDYAEDAPSGGYGPDSFLMRRHLQTAATRPQT